MGDSQQSLFGGEAIELPGKKVPKKVEVIITNYSFDGTRCKYVCHKGGTEFTSVEFMANNYGGGVGCDNEEEIKQQVQHYVDWIKREGDVAVVVDKRKQEVFNEPQPDVID